MGKYIGGLSNLTAKVEIHQYFLGLVHFDLNNLCSSSTDKLDNTRVKTHIISAIQNANCKAPQGKLNDYGEQGPYKVYKPFCYLVKPMNSKVFESTIHLKRSQIKLIV